MNDKMNGQASETSEKQGQVTARPKKKRTLKIALIIMCVLFSLVALAGGVLYGVFSHYYGMLDYEELFSGDDSWSVETIEEDPEEETIDSSKLASDEEKDKYLEQVDKVDKTDKTDKEDNDQAGGSGNFDIEIKKVGGSLGTVERSYDCEYISEQDDVINILLIGIDSRFDISAGLSDVMMVISVCPSDEKIVLTSFLRDVYVMIPGIGGNRLNAAYSYGGPSLLVETIEKNFGLRIDRYVMTNFYSFIDTVNHIGSINVYLNQKELEVINKHIYWNNQIIYKGASDNKTKNMLELQGPGYYELSGIQALAYARIRSIDSDFGRTNRQRIVLRAMYEKASKLPPSEWNEILQLILPKIKTNLSQNDILKIMLNIGVYMKCDIKSSSVPFESNFKYMQIAGRSVIGVDLDLVRAHLKETIYGQ